MLGVSFCPFSSNFKRPSRVRASSAAFDTEKWGHSKFPDTTFISWPEAANEFNNKSLMPMQDALDSALTILDDVGAENDPWKICADKLCQILPLYY